ncbi:hypothetical protein ASD54_20580 [Rhizobium sp. Root149]|uniref:hypothetical protein n=1 Tax=Rhizobium sp. Root149 TaxID=1736473 RepID=UPI000714CCD3|nr:hypothetical protein [Rhizobium sp. Root149]KQZ47933.1 hypothetical protein ASD54_20580 [Rhizobium sp. Root149]
MQGASISRWTMSYFACALIFLLIGLCLMAAGFGFPQEIWQDPATLITVHAIALGWLGLLFCGALLQFVPVLASRSLRFSSCAAPALLLILAGLTLLLSGFASLGGFIDAPPVILPAGGLLLCLGLGLVALMCGATLVPLSLNSPPGVFVLTGLAALTATLLLGLCFTLVLSGVSALPWLIALTAFAVPIHAGFGLVGWMGVTAIGVSYRLFSMFLLSQNGGRGSRLVPAFTLLALLCLLASLAIVTGFMTLAALAFAAIAAAVYVRDVIAIARTRRRKKIEPNMFASLVALAFLPIGLGLVASDALADFSRPLAVTGFYLLAMGWLSGLGLAQLYKIIPFLTWLETYGPAMGRGTVPAVQDLVREKPARIAFAVYFAAVCSAAIGLAADLPTLFRTASGGMAFSVLILIIEFIRARRLFYVPLALKLPKGAQRPLLFIATARQE